MVEKKDIATCIILSIITCGIYSIVWFYNITCDMEIIDKESDIKPSTAVLLNIITCGVYGIYWNYMMGKKLYNAGINNDQKTDDNSVLYLILSFAKLDIVSYCLIQTEINKYAE